MHLNNVKDIDNDNDISAFNDYKKEQISLRKYANVFIPSPRTYLLSSKQLNDVLFKSYVQIACNLLCILFISCLTTLKHQHTNYVSVFYLLLLALFISLLSKLISENISDFKPTNSTILLPFSSSFILLNTFLFELS